MSIDEHRIVIGRILLKSTTKTLVEHKMGRNVVKLSFVVQRASQWGLFNTI